MPITVEGKKIPVVAIVGRYYAVKEDGGPDYDKIEGHIQLAEKFAVEIWGAGFAVFTPHLNTRHFEVKTKVAETVYQAFDLFILNRMDCIFVLPNWKESRGGRKEVAVAIENNIPVFDSIEEMIKWRDKIDGYKTLDTTQCVDLDKIAEGLGAERVGKVSTGAGFFGAQQTALDVENLKKRTKNKRHKSKK
ncbi:MAG: hypothetical protein UT37_C0012G0013 [Parcubacteria group bacterium GW2011_GWA2_39_18]|nr:MAG: hypothetical protein UT37_C0012G0013 [Parcubacteria group bacterium GW2011_GWA2_39_18]